MVECNLHDKPSSNEKGDIKFEWWHWHWDNQNTKWTLTCKMLQSNDITSYVGKKNTRKIWSRNRDHPTCCKTTYTSKVQKDSFPMSLAWVSWVLLLLMYSWEVSVITMTNEGRDSFVAWGTSCETPLRAIRSAGPRPLQIRIEKTHVVQHATSVRVCDACCRPKYKNIQRCFCVRLTSWDLPLHKHVSCFKCFNYGPKRSAEPFRPDPVFHSMLEIMANPTVGR